MYLDVLARRAPAEGARIEARTLPLKVECLDCGQQSEVTREIASTLVSGGMRLKRLSGRECMVERLEVD